MSSSSPSSLNRSVVEQVLWSLIFQQAWFPYPTGTSETLWTTLVKTLMSVCPSLHVVNHRWSYNRLYGFWKNSSCKISYQDFLRQHAVSEMPSFFWGFVYMKWQPSMKEWCVTAATELEACLFPVLVAEGVIRHFLSKRVVPWYRQHRWVEGMMILRHRKAGIEDRVLMLTYPRYHAFWSVAFQGGFGKDQVFGKGSFLVPVGKMGTTFEAVEVYQQCLSSIGASTKRQIVEEYVRRATNSEEFADRMGHLLVLAEMWDDPSLHDRFQLGIYLQQWFTEYVKTTLYNTKKVSMSRIRQFVKKTPFLGEYLWKTNFAKESSRRILATRLGLATKHMSAFVRSSEWSDLQQWVHRKEDMGKAFMIRYRKIFK